MGFNMDLSDLYMAFDNIPRHMKVETVNSIIPAHEAR
jgi:hypothetical protein